MKYKFKIQRDFTLFRVDATKETTLLFPASKFIQKTKPLFSNTLVLSDDMFDIKNHKQIHFYDHSNRNYYYKTEEDVVLPFCKNEVNFLFEDMPSVLYYKFTRE